MAIAFVPVRWWQLTDFIHTSLQVTRDHDLWADRILSRPWALSSLVEYGYLLINLASSNPFFITVSGERVGGLWLTRRSDLLYLNSLGLAPRFRTSDESLLAGRILVQTVRFMEEYAARHDSRLFALKTRADNNPVQRMSMLFHCRSLGLAIAALRLSSAVGPVSSRVGIEVEPVRRSQAVGIWKRWRLYGVAQVAGQLGVEAANSLMKWFYWMTALPRGQYRVLYQDGREIGFAFAHRREDGMEVGLFPLRSFYSDAQTVMLLEALAAHLKSPVRYVTVTRAHADGLGQTEHLDHERERDLEWVFLFRPVNLDLWRDVNVASQAI